MTKPVSRRDVLLSAGGALTASALLAASPPRANAASGKLPPPPRNTGRIGSKKVPRTAWTRTAAGSLRGIRYADGRTFAITESGLTALDARTGRELWSIPLLTTDADSGDVIADGTWYVCGLDSRGERYGLMAVDCATGHIKWTYTPPGGVALNGTSGPLDGAVYVNVYEQTAKRRQLWAIDVTTRRVRWKSPCSVFDTEAHAPAGGTRVFSCDGAAGGRVTAFDAASGKEVWKTNYLCCSSSHWPAGKTVITYSANTVMGLNATTGAPVWQASPPLPAVGVDTLITEVFARSDETYYVWDGAKLMAFLAGSRGRHLWSAAVNTGDLILGISAQFGSDDTMYVGSGDGFRYAVDTRTGGCRWQYPGGRRSEIDMIDAPVAGGGGYCFIAPDYLNSGKIVALADV